MVPFTIGEQTRGSVVRPASFCGVTGFKPTYGLLSLEGVLPLSKSLDTLGFFTHTPADTSALWDSLGHSMSRSEIFDLGAPEPLPAVEPTMALAFRTALSRLRSAGTSIRPIDISGMLAKLADASLTVMRHEGARFHKPRYDQFGDRLGDLAELVRQGLQIFSAALPRPSRPSASMSAITEFFPALIRRLRHAVAENQQPVSQVKLYSVFQALAKRASRRQAQ
jgi:Asp-tRNA(Asn)/Glu-tRNA(Gln) amidotransferase A subunit family amidase